MKVLVLTLILSSSVVTTAFGQSACADLQKKFDQVRASPYNGDSWTAVQESFGTPSQTRQRNDRIASVVYSSQGCDVEFFINVEGKIYDKNFKLHAFPSPESNENPTPATEPAADAPLNVSPELAEAIKNLSTTIQQLKAQLATVEQELRTLRNAAGLNSKTVVSSTPMVAPSAGARNPANTRKTTRTGRAK